nr:uncharacterized protein LOC118680868 [Bactrocera oleae]
MEQLSRSDSRLSATERNKYLRKLFGEHDSDSSRVSDSDDKDSIPANRARHQNQQGNSVRNEPEDSEDTEEIVKENSAVGEEVVKSSKSKDDDNKVETVEPESSKIFILAVRKRCQLARLSKKF